jgi:hypothetical protein
MLIGGGQSAWVVLVGERAEASVAELRVLSGHVTAGPMPPGWKARAWPYRQCSFLAFGLDPEELAALFTGQETCLSRNGCQVRLQVRDGQFGWTRRPSEAQTDVQSRGPATTYTFTLSDVEFGSLPSDFLVGTDDVPSFPAFSAAYEAFFHNDFRVTGSQNPVMGQLTLEVIDERGRIDTIAREGDVLSVAVSGTGVESMSLELNSASWRTQARVPSSESVRLDIPSGELPPDSWVWLKSEGEWVDYRSLQPWSGALSADVRVGNGGHSVDSPRAEAESAVEHMRRRAAASAKTRCRIVCRR